MTDSFEFGIRNAEVVKRKSYLLSVIGYWFKGINPNFQSQIRNLKSEFKSPETRNPLPVTRNPKREPRNTQLASDL
jgi:hypothetical protein